MWPDVETLRPLACDHGAIAGRGSRNDLAPRPRDDARGAPPAPSWSPLALLPRAAAAQTPPPDERAAAQALADAASPDRRRRLGEDTCPAPSAGRARRGARGLAVFLDGLRPRWTPGPSRPARADPCECRARARRGPRAPLPASGPVRRLRGLPRATPGPRARGARSTGAWSWSARHPAQDPAAAARMRELGVSARDARRSGSSPTERQPARPRRHRRPARRAPARSTSRARPRPPARRGDGARPGR